MSVKITNAEELGRAIAEAYQSGDQVAQVTAWQGFCRALSDQVRQDAAAIGQQMDADALRQRGYRVLTQAEHRFWEKVIDAMNAPQPKQAFATIVGSTNGEDMMPTTILEDVYQDLQHSHPLLSAIGIEYTGYVIKWVLNNHTAAPAKYGGVTDEDHQGDHLQLLRHRHPSRIMLSCYAIVEKGMLDLGPVWLDGYVRTCMVEGMAQAMEKAAISGTGKDSPVGMDRDLSAAYTDASGYTQKTAVEVTSFDAASYGALVAKLRHCRQRAGAERDGTQAGAHLQREGLSDQGHARHHRADSGGELCQQRPAHPHGDLPHHGAGRGEGHFGSAGSVQVLCRLRSGGGH